MKTLVISLALLLTACSASTGHASSKKLLKVAAPIASCIGTPCSLSINFPYDAVGIPDTRPGTWGTTAYDDGKIQFLNVPAGYLVRIDRVYGNWTVRLHCPTFPAPCPPPAQGLYAGALFGLLNTASTGSTYATLASSGCMLYLQVDVGPGESRVINFDTDTRSSGLLAADSVLLVRRAIYLNELPLAEHQEPSFIVLFEYVPQ